MCGRVAQEAAGNQRHIGLINPQGTRIPSPQMQIAVPAAETVKTWLNYFIATNFQPNRARRWLGRGLGNLDEPDVVKPGLAHAVSDQAQQQSFGA